VHPIIGGKDVAEINTQDVLAVLQPIWVTKNETASRVRSRIELIINAARARGFRTEPNPAIWRGHLDTLLPKPSKVQQVRHHPAMPWEDLPDFWKKLSGHTGNSANALRLLILTATRTTEVRDARWDEFDEQSNTWTIPASRMKAGKAHTVPLSAQAARIIAEQRDEHSEWVFPGARGKSGLSNMAMAMLLRELSPEHTVHGFRSSFRVWGAEETNHPSAVLESALAHSIRNATEAAYQRSDLLNRRRSLMDDWAQFVTGDRGND
jgi:integrase